MSKNLNQVDIGGPERGSCLETGFSSLACPATQPPLAITTVQGFVDRSIPTSGPYLPAVLLIASNTCSFRPPDDDSSLAVHPTESGAGRLQRYQPPAVPG